MAQTLVRLDSDTADIVDSLVDVQRAVVEAGDDLQRILAVVARAAIDLIPDVDGATITAQLNGAALIGRAGREGPHRLSAPMLHGDDRLGMIRLFGRQPLDHGHIGLGRLLGGMAVVALAARQAAGIALAEVAQVERRFEATFSQSPVGIAHVSPDGRFLLVNDTFCAITGHTRDALLHDGFQAITHPDDLGSDLAHVQRLLSGEDARYAMEKRYVRPDGSLVWVNLTVALIRDPDGLPDFFVSVIEDVSDIKRAHADAIRDPLTGLLNRRGFMDRGAREVARAARSGQGMALVYLDLDGFKAINDSHGHATGDTCLAAVARTIEQLTRPGDTLARLGGDEFAIIMPQISPFDAQCKVERLRAAIATIDIGPWSLSASFGLLSRTPGYDTTLDDMIAHADAAMFEAKRGGKNRVVSVTG